MSEVQKCTRCGITKDFSHFNVNIHGITSRCTQCTTSGAAVAAAEKTSKLALQLQDLESFDAFLLHLEALKGQEQHSHALNINRKEAQFVRVASRDEITFDIPDAPVQRKNTSNPAPDDPVERYLRAYAQRIAQIVWDETEYRWR